MPFLGSDRKERGEKSSTLTYISMTESSKWFSRGSTNITWVMIMLVLPPYGSI